MSETREEHPEYPTWKSAQASVREQKQLLSRQKRTERWFEIMTAILLGVVAVATAWSGVQSTRYAQASALRVVSTRDLTLAGQLRLYDAIAVNNWINAYTQGNTTLATLYAKRFRPEFKPAFEAWLALDPFNNPNAPPGPLLMPQYKLSVEDQANQLDAQAEHIFEQGQAANQQSDDYVLNAVFLASALFLTAIAQRFDWNIIRALILALGLGMLLFGIYHLITYPIM